MKSFSKNR